jgi:hypothetical protein
MDRTDEDRASVTSAEVHDEPNCDPSVDCKFVGPRDCPCRCHFDTRRGCAMTDTELAEIERDHAGHEACNEGRLIIEVRRLRDELRSATWLVERYEAAERLCARCGKELDGSQTVVNDLANRYEEAMHRIEDLEEELRAAHAPDDFEEFGHPLDGAGDNPRFPA